MTYRIESEKKKQNSLEFRLMRKVMRFPRFEGHPPSCNCHLLGPGKFRWHNVLYYLEKLNQFYEITIVHYRGYPHHRMGFGRICLQRRLCYTHIAGTGHCITVAWFHKNRAGLIISTIVNFSKLTFRC